MHEQSKSAAKRAGRWPKGQSGNPAGKQPGTGPVQMLRAAISEHVPDIIEQLVKRALEGDTQAARILLDKVLPSLRPVEPSEAIPLPVAGTLTEKARAVLAAVGTGELAPGTAAQVIAAIAALAKVTEADELESRIKALEAAHGDIES